MPVFALASKKQKARDEARKEYMTKKAEEQEVDLAEDEEDEASFIGDDELHSSEEDHEEQEEVAEEEEEEADEATPAAAATTGKGDAEKPVDAAKLEISEPAQWVERMALTSTRSLPADLHADDDPKREEAFIQQTLQSVKLGLSMLEAAGVPWKRPNDYYAEMFKSDVHMNDVRQAISASKSRVEAQAHRRAMKDQKKYGKEVQAEVMRQRAKYKRDMQDRLEDWKKKRKGNGALRDLLNEDEDDARGPAKRGRTERTPRARNVRPGGAKKRPGKNARGRR